MSKVCQITGKRPATGNNRSHSLRATKRRFMPNVSKKVVIDPVTGKKIRIKISTRAQRTLLKNPAKYAKQMAKLVKNK